MSLWIKVLAALLALGAWLLWGPTDLAQLVKAERIERLVARAGIRGPLAVVGLMTLAVVMSRIPNAPIAMAAGAGHGLSRLMPFVSYDLISYAVGLSCLRFRRFCWRRSRASFLRASCSRISAPGGRHLGRARHRLLHWGATPLGSIPRPEQVKGLASHAAIRRKARPSPALQSRQEPLRCGEESRHPSGARKTRSGEVRRPLGGIFSRQQSDVTGGQRPVSSTRCGPDKAGFAATCPARRSCGEHSPMCSARR